MINQRFGSAAFLSVLTAAIRPRRLLVSIAVGLAAGCADPSEPRRSEPSSIEITASSDTLTLGGPDNVIALRAIVRTADGVEFEGADVSWSSELEVIPTDSRSANLTWKSALTSPTAVVVNASIPGNGGVLQSSITVTACPVFQVDGFASSLVRVNRQMDLTATSVRAPGGPVVAVTPIWRSSDPAVLSVSGSVATAMNPGTVLVEATACRKSWSRFVTVVPSGYTVTPVELSDTTGLRLTEDGRVIALRPSPAAAVAVWSNGAVSTSNIDGCTPLGVNDAVQVLCEGNGPTIWENGIATARDTVNFLTEPANGLHGVPVPLGITDAGEVIGRFMIWRTPGEVVRANCETFRCWGQGMFNDRGEVFIANDGPVVYVERLWNPDVNFPFATAGNHERIAAFNDSSDHVASGPLGSDALYQRTSVGAWTRIELGDVGSVVDMNNRRAILSNMGDQPVLTSAVLQVSLNAMLDDADWVITRVMQVNDSGRILARARRLSTGAQQSSLVVLDPSP